MQIATTAAFIPQPHPRRDERQNPVPQTAEKPDKDRLDLEQLRELAQLRQRDREVRAHEMAHLAAAGPYAVGGPSYEYRKGPDGQRYAIGGHVNIDTSPVPGDPEATLRKAETIRRAALAPGDPSPRDRSVAAAAAAMAVKARIELQQKVMAGGVDRRLEAYREQEGHDERASLIDLYG